MGLREARTQNSTFFRIAKAQMSRLLRIISAIACVVIGAPLRAQAPNAFQDMPRDHWAYKALNSLQSIGLAHGYPMGHFSGVRMLTRYELALAVDRALRSSPSLRPDNSPASESA